MTQSVVVKERQRSGPYTYDVEDLSARSQSTRAAYEASSLAFLATTEAKQHFPRLLGTDYDLGVTVIEDLGEGETIADLLVGTDPQAAERGLVAFASALGAVHAATGGKGALFEDTLHQYGRRPSNPLADTAQRDIQDAIRQMERLSAPVPEAAMTELAGVASRLGNPDQFLTWTHGDTCPGHDRLFGARCRFIDVEFGAFRHAFYDLAYLYVPFPSCGIVGRIPPQVTNAVARAYREAAAGLEGVDDDIIFNRELSVAWAYWIIWSINTLVEGARTSTDAVWGNATHRQRLIQRLEDFGAQDDPNLPAFRGWATTTAAAFHRLWPDTEPLLPYAAFRTGA